MNCPSCGHQSGTEARFCAGCGRARAASCARCGAALRPEAQFCHGCGERISPPDSAPVSPHTPAVPLSFAGGRYQVKRFLGEGGKKRVYLAHDTRLDRDVAVALIKTDGLDRDGVDRIRREAQAMARLGDHPHIVTVHDIGEEGGQPYLVTQFMAGGDVEGLLERSAGERLPLAEALRIAEQICQALEHAHAHRIIHRDLKPGNVWLTAGGTVKLGDFGLALALDRTRLTQEDMLIGTLAYMSPEQATARPLDPRTDLYSLGVMLYEMVTGRRPFQGDSVAGLIFQHVHTAPMSPIWHSPEVSPALERLILRLLAKSPEERPPDAATVRQALAGIAERLSRPAAGPDSATAVEQPPPNANLLDRLAGGSFVGRTAELEMLRGAFEESLAGRGRLVMLVGEAGIGKTRTIGELAAYARMRGAQVLWGRCYEGGGAPAFWPWVQAIRAYVQTRDPATLRSELGSGATAIAQVVSEVRERLPDLPPPPPLEPEQARFRLFDSVVSFLMGVSGPLGAAGRSPLLLVLDDLQWADTASLRLLQFLARELRDARPMPRGGDGGAPALLVVGAYRDVETDRRHPLSEVLADLSRERLVERIHLKGLAPAEVTTLLESLARHELDARGRALAGSLHRETEGNPFFIEELVRHLVEAGGIYLRDGQWVSDTASIDALGVPEGVREVIGRRLSRLSDGCARVLTVAALIGREFGLEVLERVSDLEGDRLLDALEEAAAARVIGEEPGTPGDYHFTNALVRQVLVEELSAVRRVRLHARIGAALEARWGAAPGPHLAQIAHHFFAAVPGGDAAKAVEYAQRAGDRALSSLAYEEGVRLYEMALRALEMQPPAGAGVSEAGPPAPQGRGAQQRCELLLALGDARSRSGDAPGAKEAFTEAAGLARGMTAQPGGSDPAPLARAALGLGTVGAVAQTGVVDESLIHLLEEAAQAFGGDETALHARVLAQLARARYWAQIPERTAELSGRAVAMARRLEDPAALADALTSRHWVLSQPDATEERLSIATEIVRLAEQAGDKTAALEGHLWRLTDLIELDDVAGADAELAAYAGLASELKRPQFVWYSTTLQAMRALWDGRFEQAERLMQEALSIGARTQHPDVMAVFAAQLFALRREQGRLQELEGFFTGFIAQYPAIPVMLRAGLAELHLSLGREAAAREQFERLAAGGFAGLRRDVSWLTTIVILSEVCAALSDAARAATLYELLLPYAGRGVVVGSALLYLGSASRYLGLLATAMSLWDEAAQHFDDALETNARMGARPWTAHTQHDYAAMLLAGGWSGDRRRATELLSQALATAQELGMPHLAERVRALRLTMEGIEA